ncbi:MAG: D-aminoacyl-tRNA deacylase [bacterium]
MKVVVQRSKESSVSVDNKIIGKIKSGMVILVGFTHTDNEENIDKMIKKIINLRIFDDENGVMNKSILDTNQEILSISQFTLYGNAKKGNRPSYIDAMNGNEAEKLYNIFNEKLGSNLKVETGKFGADMLVNIENDGPITIILDN